MQTNKALKEGDVLFRIDSKPHQYVVEQRAMLARWAPPAKVASYTAHGHHVSMIRKILPRMRGWQNYIFLEEH